MSLSLIRAYLKDDKITFFDVGAKGGIKELKNLAPVTSVFAFEPNPNEYNKLLSDQTNYLSVRFFNEALGNNTGEIEFHIANKASYSSLLTFDSLALEKHYSLMPKYGQWKHQFSIKKTIAVKMNTIGHFCQNLEIDQIDFLKLDTQGSELEILQGCQKYLQHIQVIKCEVNFTPVYKGQAVFSQIDLFLRNQGFEFVDCIFYPESAKSTILKSGKLPVDRQRFATGGDAVYMKDPLKASNQSKFKIALILSSMGYLSEGYTIFKNLQIPERDIKLLLNYASRKGLLQNIKDIARNWLPPKVIQSLKWR